MEDKKRESLASGPSSLVATCRIFPSRLRESLTSRVTKVGKDRAQGHDRPIFSEALPSEWAD